MPTEPSSVPPSTPRRRNRLLTCLVALVVVYLVVAYLVMPAWWKRYVQRHPAFADIPHVTHTGSGIPGDPINVALVGSKSELIEIMLAAKWYPADPLSFKSCLEIAAATVLERPYDAAPVSSLYLFGRKEDIAFEQPVGNDPRKRHHVRFWQTDKLYDDGRPVWVGSAVYDEHVGLSRTTGQVTHVTGADVDAERDYLFRDLEATGDLADHYALDDFHQIRAGKNGGGDPWHTDGSLLVGVIALTITKPRTARRHTMIDAIPMPNAKVLGFQMSGKLHDEDYKKFVPLVDDAIAKQGKVRLLAQFHDFHGWDAKALWDDIKFSTTHCTKIERIALVGDKTWEKWMATVCKPFTMAKVKYFDVKEMEAAKTWLAEA